MPTVCECQPVAQGSVLWQPGQLLSWWGLLRIQGQPWNLGWQEMRPAGRPERDAEDTILGCGMPVSDLGPLDLSVSKGG